MIRIFIFLGMLVVNFLLLPLSGLRNTSAAPAKTKPVKKREYVVMLHGIARSSKHMRPLAQHLQNSGYTVVNLDYPSTQASLETLVDSIYQDIAARIPDKQTVHWVGYSMGALLVRAILYKYSFTHPGRVVLLAPPNHGSEVADFLQNNWFYRKIYGPAGQQMITDQTAIKHLFDKKIDYELGIIAGRCSIDPFSSCLIPGKDDGKVSVESTKLAGMKAHIIVPASHTFFPEKDVVQQQTAYFLRYGTFQTPDQTLDEITIN